MGTAITFASVGTGLPDENEFIVVAAGAPELANPDGSGFVQITDVDRISGNLLAGTTSPRNQVISAPPSFRHYGASLHAADIRVCHAPPSGGPERLACGQELLVGAPDAGFHGSPGKVHWLQPEGDITSTFASGGVLSAPTGAPSTAEFGTAIASWAPPLPTRDQLPWVVAPNPAHWIAISAPGDPSTELVYVYAADPVSSAPLSLIGAISIPSATAFGTLQGKGFGTSLVSGDFDGDGIRDLAVGMPWDNSGTAGGTPAGVVAIYFGNSSAPATTSSMPFGLGAPLLVTSGVSGPDEFGYSLASGRIFTEHDGEGASLVSRDGLVVGAPGANLSSGGVCDFEVTSRTASISHCRLHLPTSPGYGGSRFGQAVAVGNFAAVDDSQLETTDVARQDEVAVGVPKRAGGGGVDIYAGSIPGPNYSLLVSSFTEPAGIGSDMGASLATGYVSFTPWADLAIGGPASPVGFGGPNDGAAYVTRAVSTSFPTCQDVDGTWATTDDGGNLVDVRITSNSTTNTTSITFLDPVVMEFVRTSDGSTCFFPDGNDPDTDDDEAIFTIPAGLSFTLSTFYTCPGSCNAQVFTKESVGPLIESAMRGAGVWDGLSAGFQGLLAGIKGDITLTYQQAGSTCNSGSTDQVLIDIQVDSVYWTAAAAAVGPLNADCRPASIPWTAENTGIIGVCE